MTAEQVIQDLAERASHAYIHAPEQSQRWQDVARAVLEAVARKSDVPLDQLLGTLAGNPINLEAPQGTAQVPMSGPTRS